LDLLSSFGEFVDSPTNEIIDKIKLLLQNEKVKEDSTLKLEIEIQIMLTELTFEKKENNKM